MSTVTLAAPRAARSQSGGWIEVLSRSLPVAVLTLFLLPVFWQGLRGHSPFLPFAITGATLFHLSCKPRWREAACTAVLAVALGAWFALQGHTDWSIYSGERVVAWLSFAGFASLVALAVRSARDTAALRPFLMATVTPLAMVLVNLGLGMTIALDPEVYDQFLYQFDASLGFQASFEVGRWFVAWPLLRQVSYLMYAGIPLMAVATQVVAFRGRPGGCTRTLASFLAAGIAGFVLYQLCPAAGPYYLFREAFPHAVPVLAHAHLIPLPGPPRNAIPSLHAAWALIIVSNGWPSRWFRPLTLIFLGFTILATLGFGEHYLIDLIVGVPFALAVESAVRKQPLLTVSGLAITAAWLLYLRTVTQPLPGVLAWFLVLATLIGCGLLVRKRAFVSMEA